MRKGREKMLVESIAENGGEKETVGWLNVTDRATFIDLDCTVF